MTYHDMTTTTYKKTDGFLMSFCRSYITDISDYDVKFI